MTAEVAVGPLPTQTSVTTVQTPGESYVVLQVHTPQGIAVFFLSPAHAQDLARHLEDYSKVAGSGLVIAGVDQLPDSEVQP